MDFHPSHAGMEYVLACIIQDFMQFMRRTGLSTPQITTLIYIFHSPNNECKLSEIGALTASSKPAVSQLVERLVNGIGREDGGPAGQAEYEIATHR